MKIKNKKKIAILIVLIVLLFGNFFIAKTQAATLAEQCTFSGGTFNGNKCTNCGCGKVTGPGQGAVCVTKEEYDTATAYGDPSAAPDIQITECKNEVVGEVAPGPRQFNYKLLEAFPGFFSKDQVLIDFPKLILSIYKFGIWTVGIAGLFMLVVGGFTYMTSAGNTSTAGSGKKIIWDALLGIVAALGAYLILYVINPDLTRITIGDSAIPVGIFDNIDATNPGGKTECQNCVSVQDICKENPCSLNTVLAGKLRSALQGQNARITEGWPATANHTSSCHGNGTCADVNLTVNKGDVQAVKNLYNRIKSAGLNPIYEDTASGCVKYNAVGVNCHPYPTMTAPSFHVNM